METTKKHSKVRKGLSVFLSLTIVFSFFSFADYSADETTTAGYTGEQYFRAIFFKQGELTSSIYKGELNEMVKDEYSAEEKADVAELQNVIYTTIKSKNTSFISEFERGIESNDLKTIEATVNKGGDLIVKTLQAIDKNSLRDNRVFQKYLRGSQEGSTAEMQSCTFYTLGIVIDGFPMMGWVVYFYPMSIIAMSMSQKEQQTQLYREQFVYNIYQVQK